MYGNSINNLLNGLSLSKVLNGINQGLNIASRAVPIYRQIKPIFKNSKSLINMLDIINTKDDSSNNDNNEINNENINENEKTNNDTLPVFFQ